MGRGRKKRCLLEARSVGGGGEEAKGASREES